MSIPTCRPSRLRTSLLTYSHICRHTREHKCLYQRTRASSRVSAYALEISILRRLALPTISYTSTAHIRAYYQAHKSATLQGPALPSQRVPIPGVKISNFQARNAVPCLFACAHTPNKKICPTETQGTTKHLSIIQRMLPCAGTACTSLPNSD